MDTITVSIVEDLNEVRESLENLIRDSDNFLLLSAYPNAEAAQKKIPEEQPQIVIMDINLPGISGIDCIRKIKPLCLDTQFMMYSIFEDDERCSRRWRREPAVTCLKKHQKKRSWMPCRNSTKAAAP